MVDFLGRPISELLTIEPISGWPVSRSIDEDLPAGVRYEFSGHGVEVICDDADRIRTIFIHRGDGEALVDVAFSASRQEVLARFGTPEVSGAPALIPLLGDYGAWDRFVLPGGSRHIQYRRDHDEIEMLTLMRPDAVP